MSPPDWGAEFAPLPASEDAAAGPEASAVPGSSRSSFLPGLSIGPEVFPGATLARPTPSRALESRFPGGQPTPSLPTQATNWPSRVEGRSVPAQAAGSVLRPSGETPALGSAVPAPGNLTGFPAARANPQASSPTPLLPTGQLPQESPSAYFPAQPGVAGSVSPVSPFAPGFDPGFRQAGQSGNSLDWLDQGQQFPHEAGQHYPPMSEILKTGRYFGSLEWQLLQPHLQNNTALIRSSPGSFSSQQFNWTYESAPRFRAGFESKYGPGVELDYWQFDHDSSSVTGSSDGVTSFTSVLPQGQAGTFNQLSATAAGDRLIARQGLELHAAGISFFKEMKLPIARLAGTFGLRYLSIAQQAETLRLDSSGAETGSLRHLTDFRGFGPRIRLDYFRPVGHTKLESLASFGSSLLYGNRDQFVSNSLAGSFTRTDADELVTSVEAAIGVQYVKHLGENRSAFVRLTYQSQTWLGGGTGTDAAGDLGFRGLGISVGANR